MQHFVYPNGILPKNAATESTSILIKQMLPGSLLAGISFDYFSVDYFSATVEKYKYYLGGPTGTLKRTITLTYTDSTKTFLSNAGIS